LGGVGWFGVGWVEGVVGLLGCDCFYVVVFDEVYVYVVGLYYCFEIIYDFFGDGVGV